MRRRGRAPWSVFVMAVVFIFLLDQAVKFWSIRNLSFQESRPLIPGLVRLVHVENTGAAFSLLGNHRLFLLIVSAGALLVLITALLRGWPRHPLGAWAMTSIAGGALGNFYDRAAQGHVTDMFEFEFVQFAIFNVADIFITTGGVLLCVYLLYFHETKEKTPDDVPQSL